MKPSELAAEVLEVVKMSKHCTSPEGGRIPTYRLKQAAAKLLEMEKLMREIFDIIDISEMSSRDMEPYKYEAVLDDVLNRTRRAIGDA